MSAPLRKRLLTKRGPTCTLPRHLCCLPFVNMLQPCDDSSGVRRYVAQVIAESGAGGSGGEARPFYSFLESCLRHKAEMVIFEAARAICAMRDVSTRELAPAVTVLQLFLSSSKPVLRFAAVRTLNKARPSPPSGGANLHAQILLLMISSALFPWRCQTSLVY